MTYYVKSGTRITEQVSVCVYKAYTFFFKRFARLDPYSSSGLIYSSTETVILTFNRLESIEANYMDTNPGMLSSKTLISFRLKKEIHKILDDMGVSKW